MAGTSFVMPLEAFAGAIGTAAARLADTQHLAAAIGEALVSGTQDRFEQGEAPDRSEWPASQRGGQTLVDTARLKNSIGYEASPDMVAVGTSVDYAHTHQKGATIKPKNAKNLKFKVGDRWVSKKEVTIPARPFIGISKADEAEARACCLRHLQRAFT